MILIECYMYMYKQITCVIGIIQYMYLTLIVHYMCMFLNLLSEEILLKLLNIARDPNAPKGLSQEAFKYMHLVTKVSL